MNCKENCRKKSNRNDKGEKMQKITDLRGIKDTVKVFLHMNIEETKFSPLVIKHPFTDSAMVCLSQADGEIAFANIMEDTKAFTIWKEQVEKQIDTAEDVFGVYHQVSERNPAAKPFLRSKNTDQLWFEGKKTGFFRLKNARFLPSENCVLTDDIHCFKN